MFEAMIVSFDLLGVFADLVILLTLGASVTSPRVSQLARPVIAVFAFMCAWLSTALAFALRGPGWITFMGAAVIVVSILVVTVTVHVWTQARDVGPGRLGDHGGGGPRRGRPDAPQHGDGGGDPSW